MLNILIVDDSKMARKRIKEALIKLEIDYSISGEGEDGVQGLELYKELKPNLIITDLEMPNMNGLELIEEIRKLDASLHIIVISSLSNEQIKQTIKHDRFADFIKKPIDERILKIQLLKAQHHIEKGVQA